MTKIKNKRKIKVPKAQKGLETVGSNWQTNMTNQLFADQNTAFRNQLSNAASMMQLKADMVTSNPLGAFNFNNGTNFNQYNTTDTGNSNIPIKDLLQSMPEITALLSSPFQTSDASTGKEATAQSISDIASGIGTGASIGSSFGPMGAIAGAGIGAAVGLVGKKGREAGMTSFTDYDEGSLGTGLIGAFSNRKLRKKRDQIKMNALNNRAAVAGTEYLRNEYAEDNSNYNTNTFAEGGSIPSSLAYVDDGELISTPDGRVSKVPEEGKPVDSNLVNLPEGSRVLSNTLKVPGTKKTFAQLGEEMMTKRKSKGKDRFAENANKLNEMNNKQIHDQLFAQQEAIKAKRGSKKEYKNLVEEFQTGGEKDRYPFGRDLNWWNNVYLPEVTVTAKAPRTNVQTSDIKDNRYVIDQDKNAFYELNDEGNIIYTPGINTPSDWRSRPIYLGNQRYTVKAGGARFYGQGTRRGNTISMIPSIGGFNTGAMNYMLVPYRETSQQAEALEHTPSVKPARKTTTSAQNTAQKPVTSKTIVPTPPEIDPLELIEESYEIQPTSIQPYRKSNPVENNNTEDSSDNSNPSWISTLSSLSGLAPIMSNLFTSDPEKVLANYNPYSTAISNAMRRRRFDITPAMQDLVRSRAVNDYNASQLNTNTGANMAYRLQSAIAQNNAIANLRTQENNINNQYLGEYANTMNNLGQQFVAANNLADDLNAQNRATARNIRRAGLTQLSGWFQNRELMRNQQDRDRAMLTMYRPLLQSVLTENDYNTLMRYYNR